MRTLLRTALITTILALPVGVQAADAAPAMQTASAAGTQSQRTKGVWIDVRSPEEFKEGHLNGAVNIPGDQIPARIRAVSPDKSAPVNLYCRSGRRAEAVLQTLKQMGYTNVTNHGGYQDLVNKGIR
ncbi:rhodanese-like domain-containing protein [Uruburuella testudinis]|uniref:Rhodanese-like domain-containing protein n=1 Tax=Uruburuella testudinis TaxID=1282863 RepID=A0ABY4DR53_9NEIS|nr:rhodanese-like domain-containing protein [Uruburuella testudinis]UOO81527.1 rhodanese-like domain-containing protein [Uruburuella testudinis]